MTYRLKVIYKSILITTIISTVMMTIPVNAQTTIVEYTMCYGYSTSNLDALGATTVFLTTNEEAGIWVKMTDPPESVVFKWYYPDETYYQNTNADTIKEPESDWGIAFSSINIDGRTVAKNPGKWKVEVFIEGEVWLEYNFQIIDYEEIVDDFMNLAIEFDNLRNEISSVQADYDELEAKYNKLETDYAELEAQTGSQSDLEKIQEDYDELQDDYTQLQGNLGSTRTMMYAAVVVAVASVAIAVYFGAMKK